MPHFVSSRDESVQNMSNVSSDSANLEYAALHKAWQIFQKTKFPQDVSSRTENAENERNTCNVYASRPIEGSTDGEIKPNRRERMAEAEINENRNMCDVSSDFANLKVSALRKAWQISGAIDKVTIGPKSKVPQDDSSWTENSENEINTCNVTADRSDIGASANMTKICDNSTRGSITFSVKKILLENELQRREDVRGKMKQRRRDMENTGRAFQLEIEMMREILAMKREREEAEELERLDAEEERLAQQYEIRRKHEQQLHAQRIQERKEKLERDSEEHRRTCEREELVNRITPLRTCFREKCRDIGSVSKICKDRNSAAVVLVPLGNQLKELILQMESINERTRSGDITTADLNIAENVVQQSDEILNFCKSEIARIDALYDEEIARREQAMREAEIQAQEEAALLSGESSDLQRQQIVHEEIPEAADNSPTDTQSVVPGNVDPSQYISALPSPPCGDGNNQENNDVPTDSGSVETGSEEIDGGSTAYESLRMYMNTHVFLTTYADVYRDLAQSPAMKKFRFECQKAINIPINAISGVNATHLKDKYDMLRSLLMGKSSLNVTQHPQGVVFCKDVLAKKIVSQGETLISSKPEMAFPVAAVSVALWNDYPDFGELLLAHFRRACPYILPVFLPRLQGQTNEEYYRSLGYKYSDEGVVENQDKYLTRMSGLMRLYVSIMVTRPRRGMNDPHPHGIQNAWKWLAATLNAEPRPDLSDVCATLILDILEVAGNSLWQTYPRQFPKILMLLATQYYPQMQNEAGIGGGPMARLEQFLKDCITKKMIPAPDGQLPMNFW